MRKRCAGLVLAALVFVVAAVLPAAASAQGHEMPPPGPGFLEGPGEWGKIELVSKAIVTDQDDLVADVAVDPSHEYAYLANWSDATCAENSEAGGQNAPDAGIWVIDISDIENPVEVGFIPHSQDSRPGEGLQAVEVSTKFFNGTMLISNNEQCGPQGKGGVSLYDVTNPLKPRKLSEHFGDRGALGQADVQQTHSAFAWDAGDKAYVVMTDNEEAADVDILDITNPHRPRLVADLDLNEYCGDQLGAIDQPDLGLTASFLHDMVVKQIDGEWIMLLSYWDGGFVRMNVDDPANPVCLHDTDFAATDPELLESTGESLPPEGNAHQAEFTIDNEFFIGGDEDFDPFKLFMSIAGGAAAPVSAGTATPVDEDVYIGPGETLTAPTTFLGTACGTIAPATTDPAIAVVERGECLFQDKINNVTAAGYDAIMIFNNEIGDPPCEAQLGMLADTEIPAYFVSRSVGYEILGIAGYNPANCPGGANPALPAVGTAGETLTLSSQFDGWGYVHLFDADTGAELDTFAIPEAHDPDFAFGFGDLSVHEVAVDPQDASLAYLSYYSGGLIAIQIEEDATVCAAQDDTAPCLVEVGGYRDPMGNDFWGVETFVGDDGFTYILGSDRDSGLWIFRDP